MEKMMKTIQDWKKALEKNNGFSYSFKYGDMLGEPYYVVSTYKGHEMITDHIPTDEEFKAFLNKNMDLLSKPDSVLGAWYDAEGTKKYYMDVSTIFPKSRFTEDDIIAIAKEHNQLAGFDLETMEEVK